MNSLTTRSPKGRVEYLDAIRGAAILLVIAVHCSRLLYGAPWYFSWVHTYGQFGVQLFFVASAITLSFRAEELVNLQGVRVFLVRRLFRIAPMYYVGLCLYWYLAFRTGKSEVYSLGNVAANMAFVHAAVPAANNTIVPGGWSIACEMLFYCLLPIIVCVTKLRLGRVLVSMAAWVVVWFVLVLSFQLNVSNFSFWYFSLGNQMPVFLIGIAGFGIMSKPELVRSQWLVLIVAGLLSFALVVLLNAPAGILTFCWAPIFSAGACLGIVVLFSKFKHWQFTGLAFLGRISYSCYILHFLWIYYFPLKVDDKFGIVPYSAMAFLATNGLVLVATVLVAMLTEYWIERPGILLGRRLLASIVPVRLG